MDGAEMRDLGVLPIYYVGMMRVENLPCLADDERQDPCMKRGYSSLYFRTDIGMIRIPMCQEHWDEACRKLFLADKTVKRET